MTNRESSRARRWTGTLAGAFLGAVLLLAAALKALDPAGFAETISAQGLAFLLPPSAVALLALAIETAVGTALLLGLRRRGVMLAATLLVAFFVVLNVRSYWLLTHGGATAAGDCGCFGNLLDRSPGEALAQDLLLLLPALALAFVGREAGGGDRPRRRLAVVALVTVGVVLLAWRAPGLPLDDLATRLRPGVEASELCAGGAGTRICLDGLAPELDAGRHVVILARLDSPDLLAAMDRLNAAAADGESLWLLTSASSEELRAFQWQQAPGFEVREMPQELLRPLYRRLPRSFVIENGRVVETHGGLPPLAPS